MWINWFVWIQAVYNVGMTSDKVSEFYRKLAVSEQEKTNRINQLETANIELTAALTDRGEQLEIYKEMAHGILFKQVDKYLQSVDKPESTS